MDLEQLQLQYNNIPLELKQMKRWVCYKVEGTNDGKTTKRPYNALNGSMAKSNDELTWTKFNLALQGCVKYKCDGIGFMLGAGIFGIDLDNHPDKDGNIPMTEEEFKEFSKEFIDTLDSYTEYSQSGKGVHIICKGVLPKGARKKGSVEMYDNGRFFAFTGNVIHNTTINDREKQVVPLWEKYLNAKSESTFVKEKVSSYIEKNKNRKKVELNLTDDDLIETAINSKNGDIFFKYYHDGDITLNGSDNSAADLAFCNLLAFWCNGDIEQMDRIFRNSALYREKWDELRGQKTYGEITLQKAFENFTEGYTKFEIEEAKPIYTIRNKNKINGVETEEFDNETPTVETNEEKPILAKTNETKMNIDENGEPIFRIKKLFGKKYEYTDTGNAERFYDYFGDLFKYNVTDKIFMFWTGKTWIKDYKQIIRKYANKFIELLQLEANTILSNIEKYLADGMKDKASSLNKIYDACVRNVTRVSNKAGKDAMLSEFQALYDIPINSYEFDKDDFTLNTASGIVNLKTGEITPFNKYAMLSKNTDIEVSYEEPKEWLKFLHSTFKCDSAAETQNIIDSLQTCLGYSLSGSTAEQVMFLLYGSGSNGKSTLTEIVAHVMGDYGDNIASSVLLQQKVGNNSSTYSIAKLQNKRFVETGETDDGGKLAESQVKILTGGDTISAQFKYGNEFSYKPKFKIWMSTNNKPIIRGNDFGIWRRIFLFPFINTFTAEQKDKNLPEKLRKEAPQILGWMIQGFKKYYERGDLIKPKTLLEAIQEYKEQMDIIAQFISKECELGPNCRMDCKELYKHYKNWAQDNTEFTIKESKFTEELKNKGITVEKTSSKKTYYCGIKVIGSITIKSNYEH